MTILDSPARSAIVPKARTSVPSRPVRVNSLDSTIRGWIGGLPLSTEGDDYSALDPDDVLVTNPDNDKGKPPKDGGDATNDKPKGRPPQ